VSDRGLLSGGPRSSSVLVGARRTHTKSAAAVRNPSAGRAHKLAKTVSSSAYGRTGVAL